MSKYCYPNNKENLKSPNRIGFLRALPAYHIRPLAQAYTISLSLNLQHSSSKLQYNNIEPKLVPNFKTLQIYRDSYLYCFGQISTKIILIYIHNICVTKKLVDG